MKLWEAAEYPELAANEFFCLTAARRAGLNVPEFQLSEDGAALVLDRFDLKDGVYLGFEDFCVLNGVHTADKYSGSYESRLFKRLADYTGPRTQARSVRDLFRLFVLNCALRNGDAHLKNFGILYRDVNGDAELAPVYDLVTTTAYLPRDAMALTLEGSTRWPEARRLLQLGQTRAGLAKKDVEGIFEATAQALWETSGEVEKYFRSSGFPDIGARMTVAWEEGIRESLDLIKGRPRTGAVATERAKKGEMAASDRLVLNYLRKSGGRFTGLQQELADALGLPLSTLSGAIRRLESRKQVRRTGKTLELAKSSNKLV